MRRPVPPEPPVVLLPDTDDLPPPPREAAPRVLRLATRVVLWTGLAAAVAHAFLASPIGRGQPPAEPGQAGAVAAAFVRDYLTAAADRAAWRSRLARYLAAGAEPGPMPRPPAGGTAYADQAWPAGTRAVPGGFEVTVLVHMLEVRPGAFRDAGTRAVLVRVRAGRRGVAVSGPPRPASLPVDPTLRAAPSSGTPA